jgi:hypothetical protein
MRTVTAVLLLVPMAALASSPFDGTWKTRVGSMKVTGAPDTFLIVDGVYTCSSCTPVIRIPADNEPHAVTGHPYYDAVAVMVVSPSEVDIVDSKAGNPVYTIVYTVSADGTILSARLTDRTHAQAAVEAFTARRVAPGPGGSHAVSGSWQPDQLSEANDALRTIVFVMTPADFSMQWNGESYDAKFDGNEYPVSGDTGHTTVTVRKIDDRTVEETDRREGKVTDEIHMSASKDGKTLEVTDKDMQHGQTTTVTLDKQ